MHAFQARIIALTLTAVAAHTLANIALSRGLRSGASRRRPAAGRLVALAISLMICHFLVWSYVLQAAPLSYVVPLTASSYLMNALLVGPLLDERLSKQRWCGTLLIIAGVLVVSLERPT